MWPFDLWTRKQEANQDAFLLLRGRLREFGLEVETLHWDHTVTVAHEKAEWYRNQPWRELGKTRTRLSVDLICALLDHEDKKQFEGVRFHRNWWADTEGMEATVYESGAPKDE
jgi:hypothetical protein